MDRRQAMAALSLDDYFDQLDAAFSNLQQPGAQPAETAHEEIDWAAAMAPAPAACCTERPGRAAGVQACRAVRYAARRRPSRVRQSRLRIAPTAPIAPCRTERT